MNCSPPVATLWVGYNVSHPAGGLIFLLPSLSQAERSPRRQSYDGDSRHNQESHQLVLGTCVSFLRTPYPTQSVASGGFFFACQELNQ